MGKDAGKDEGRSYLEGKLDHDGVEEATELLWRNKRTTNVGAKSVGRIEDDRSIETSNGVIKRHLQLVAVCMPLTRQREEGPSSEVEAVDDNKSGIKSSSSIDMSNRNDLY